MCTTDPLVQPAGHTQSGPKIMLLDSEVSVFSMAGSVGFKVATHLTKGEENNKEINEKVALGQKRDVSVCNPI